MQIEDIAALVFQKVVEPTEKIDKILKICQWKKPSVSTIIDHTLINIRSCICKTGRRYDLAGDIWVIPKYRRYLWHTRMDFPKII